MPASSSSNARHGRPATTAASAPIASASATASSARADRVGHGRDRIGAVQHRHLGHREQQRGGREGPRRQRAEALRHGGDRQHRQRRQHDHGDAQRRPAAIAPRPSIRPPAAPISIATNAPTARPGAQRGRRSPASTATAPSTIAGHGDGASPRRLTRSTTTGVPASVNPICSRPVGQRVPQPVLAPGQRAAALLQRPLRRPCG